MTIAIIVCVVTVINSAVYLLLASNIPLVLYFSLVHQRGGFVVMEELRKVCFLKPLW